LIPRHGVEQHVLQVDREIEQDHRCRDRQPGRDVERVEESPAAGLGKDRRADGGNREDQPEDHGVKSDNSKVAGPAPAPADLLMAPRRSPFPQYHHDKDAGEGAQADERLVGKQRR
jgi:hypothetical protein